MSTGAKWLTCFILLVLAIFFFNEANAQSNCDVRDEFIAKLGKGYSEKPVAVGLASTGNIVEVLKSIDGKTWTIIITDPHGVSCLAAVGEDWTDLYPEFPIAAEEIL